MLCHLRSLQFPVSPVQYAHVGIVVITPTVSCLGTGPRYLGPIIGGRCCEMGFLGSRSKGAFLYLTVMCMIGLARLLCADNKIPEYMWSAELTIHIYLPLVSYRAPRPENPSYSLCRNPVNADACKTMYCCTTCAQLTMHAPVHRYTSAPTYRIPSGS